MTQTQDDATSEVRSPKMQYHRQNLAMEKRRATIFKEGTFNFLPQRVTSADLKRPGQEDKKLHKHEFINDFMTTIFENFIQEYMNHINDMLKTFEDKLDMIKREVQLEYLANKKSNGRSGTEMSMTMNDRTIQENPFFNMM